MARKPYREPAPMAEILKPVLRGIRPARRDPAEQVRAVWASVVGQKTAGRTRVTTLREGELIVEVSSAALRQHLAVFRRDEVLEALRQALPETPVTAIRYRVAAGL